MIEETAQVVLVDENGTWVETRRKSSCGQCSVNAACGTSLLSSLLGNRASRIRVINKLGARTGDEVLLGMDESSMLKAAFVTYMQPLLLMLIAAMLGQAISVVIFTEPDELFTVLCAVGGFWLGLKYLRYFNFRIRDNQRYQPVILRKLDGQQSEVSLVNFQDNRKLNQ